MADEDMTREVLFPDWESPDKTGLTIEHASTGEMFVKEVKGESPAARSGKVYEGDQIVGATIYFDKMKPEDTAEVMKVLARHKVGLKLQNKADKSPCYSPMSTPCRSPIGTLTWEGMRSFGGSSPDIVLSGDDEDYRRIYTKKIKPRLKSEDLAEGVDVRTERHSSTSNDGSTITTITRRITTYMVDLPADGEKPELSSPERKGLRHESGDSSPGITIFRGNLSGKVGAEEGVFDSSDLSYTSPQGLSAEKQWCAGKVETRTIIRDGKEKCSDLQYKGSAFRVTDSKGAEILGESAEQEGESFLVSKTSTALSDSAKTANSHVTIGGTEAAETSSADKNGDSGNWSVPEKDMQIGISVKGKTNMGGFKAIFDDKTRVSTSENVISHKEKKRAGITDSDSSGDSTDVRLPITLGDVINAPNMDIQNETKSCIEFNQRIDTDTPRFKIPSFGSKCQKVEEKEAYVKVPTENINAKKAEVIINKPDFESDIENTKKKGNDFNVQIGSGKLTKQEVDEDVGVTVSKGREDIITSTKESEVTNKQTKGMKESFNIPKFKIQSFSKNVSSDDKLNAEVSLQGENTEGEAQNIERIGRGIYVKKPDNQIPNIDYNTKGTMFKKEEYKMPTKGLSTEMTKGDKKAPILEIKSPEEVFRGTKAGIKIPDVKMHTVENKDQNIGKPDVDNKPKSPKLEGDLDIKASKTEGYIKANDGDISGVEVGIGDLKDGLKKTKFKMPTFGIKGKKLEGPDVDVNLTSTDIEVKAPDVNINAPDVDIEGPDAKLKGPKFNMPKMPGLNVSMPDVDFNLKGPKLKGDIDTSLPKIEGEIKTPDLDVKGPNVDIDVTKPGFEMPTVKMPSLNIKGPKMENPDIDIKIKGPKVGGDLDVKIPKVKGDITAPDVDIGGAELDIEGPKGGFKMPKFKMPTFGSKGHKLEGPDVDVNLPSTDIDIKAPDVDINAPDVDITGPDATFKGPKFNMPKMPGLNVSMPDVDFNLKGATLKGETDTSLPKIEGEIKTPDLDVKGPDVDIDVTKPGFEMPKVKMPSLNIKGPKMEKPDVDIKLKGPKIGGDLDVKAPKIKGDITAPDVDIGGAELDIEGPKGGFKMPKFKMPTFGSKGHKLEGPDVDVNLPSTDIDIKAPDVDINAPDVDIKGPDAKFKGPKFNMPKMPGLNVSMPDVDFNLKGPKLKGDIDTSLPKIEGEIKTPDLDVKGPDVDIDVTKPGFEMPKVKMPSLNIKGPKMEKPEFDIKLKGPKIGGDLDVKAPKIKGDITAPDVDIGGAELDIEGPKGGFKMPKFKMPTFGSKGHKLEGPDVDVNLPSTDIDIKAPDVDINAPDVDIKGPDAKFKGPKFNMPKMPGLNVSMPDVDFNLKGPKLKGDIDTSLPKIEGEIKTPDLDVKGPDVDIDVTKPGFEMPKVKMPSLNIKGPKMEKPEFDIKLKGPKVGGDLDVKAPKIKGDITAPDVDIGGAELDIEGPKGGFKMPKFKMPTFGSKGHKLEGPDVDVNLPSTDIDIKAPDVDINAPDVDIKGPDAKFKGPKFNMPKMPGLNVSMPDVDFNLKGPKLKGDIDTSLPKIEGEIKTPDLDVKGPDVDIDVTKPGFEMPKVKMPSLNIKGPKMEKPDFDIKLKGPKVGGDLDVKAPKIKGDITAPDVDIGGAELDIEGPKGGFKMPKFKMPTFGSKGHKLEGPDVDVNLPSTDIDIKAPDVDINAPDVDIKGPDAKFKGPKFNMPKMPGLNVSMPDVDFNLKGPKLKGDIDTSLPKIEGEIKTPDLDVKGPDVDIDVTKPGFEMPKVKMPSLNIKGPKMEKPDFDIKLKGPKVGGDLDVKAPKIKGDITAPDVDIGGAELDIEGPKGGFKMPKFKMPTFGSKGHKLEGPDVDVNLPSADFEVKAPDVDINAPDVDIKGPDAKFKGPKFNMPKMPGLNVSMPDVDFNLKGPKLKGDIDTSLPKIEGEIKTPDLDVKGPDVDIDVTKPGFEMPKVKMSSLNIKGPKMEKPDFDIKLKGPKVGGDLDVKAPKIKGDITAPDVDIGEAELDIEGPKGGFKMPKFKMPTFGSKGYKLEGPDVDVNLPSTDIDIKAPDVDINAPDVDIKGPDAKFKGPKFNMPKMPGLNVSMPDVDFNLKSPKLKGDIDTSLPKIEGEIKTPDLNVKGPDVDFDGSMSGFEEPKVKISTVNIKGPKLEMPDADIKLKGPKIGGDLDVKAPKIKGDIKAPELSGPNISLPGRDSKIKTPMLSVGGKVSTTDVNFQQSELSVDSLDTDINVKGKKGKFKLGKAKGKWKKADADTKVLADLGEDTTNSLVKETKTKKHLFGKIHFPDVELDIKSPKMKVDGTLAEGVKSSQTDLVSPDLSTGFDGSGTVDAGVCLEGSDVKMTNIKGGLEASGSGSGLRYPEGKLTFSKIRMPKFGILKTNFEGQDSDNKVDSEVLSSGDKNTHSQSASPKLSHSEGKIKVKKPKFFGKSKAKGSTGDLHGTDIELGASGQIYKGSTELCAPSYDGGKFEMEGTSGLSVSTKSKSASLDLFKKSRHRSSSHSDEESPATSSPSVPLEAEACDVSIDMGENKVKGKKSKLKFGTFGGFGSKSKGSYEVTLGGENDTGMEGSSNVSTPSKKSRLSSSSSSESGSRAGFKFPKLELSVSPKK
ncbi:hypothetical protein OJAV_G00101800 [Oryzias javanicus]|uniref:PDZ domain-containing protein n=1 Tax=Oryzias javanicus TaxID=123683 RepID=A0A3S2MUQ3_ORYJA|nr:hypothetical protein OJAV_G00101800 [Oryzias javanicus]